MDKTDKDEFDIFIANSVYPEADTVFTTHLKSLKDVKDDCFVVLDTNALLAPYKIGPETLDGIKSTYEGLVLKSQLVIPGQVSREFAKQRANKLTELFRNLNRKKNIPKLQKGRYPLLESLPSYKEATRLEKEIDKLLQEYGKTVTNVLQNIREWTWDDPVSSMYSELFSKDIIIDPQLEKEKLRDELHRRKIHHLPPGYKDANKDDQGIGDLLIWYTILEMGEKLKKSVIFVSTDEKADWWYKSEGQALYPRYELVDEYRRFSDGQSFHIVSFSELLDLYGASEDVVMEIRESELRERKEQDYSDLTSREIEILELCQQGMMNEEIAEITSLGAGTVRNYLSSIYSKLDARNRSEAIQNAIDVGLLQPVELKKEMIENIQQKMRPTLVKDYLRISSREIEVLELLRQGFKNSEIAGKLKIGDGTTRNYTSSIYEKLGVRNRVEAVQKALELGLISDA
ncbi:MAG: hypothetical protein DRI32_07795 [Chloroflexi bacterium]|nr:MAG: hypothetical protein DRI32_07795 [Chloroflexota bacterium]